MLSFITSLGRITTIGVEGTNSYGAELARFLRQGGVVVVEAIRPTRQVRRLRGKSDPIDAYAAAHTVLAGHDLPTPKNADGDAEAIRVLTIARRSALKARTAAAVQIKSLLVTAPEALRARFRGLNDADLHAQLAAVRPGPATEGIQPATLTAMRHLARRHRALTTEITELETDLDTLVTRVAPALRAAHGIGPVTAAPLLIAAGDNPDRLTSEASFAALCGAAPIPASSGKTTRYRLNPGGDRQANAALHQIILVRMTCDPRTRSYIAKRTAQGKSDKEVMRYLKRAVAREVYHHIVHPQPVPQVDDLRPLRHAKGMTLQTIADHFNVWPAHISTIERGKRRDDDLANRYREWLLTA
ncbi:IS110 family transposase [Pseudactinotalea sp. Z1748]|uniref:IS110 family transposase n=1 Tax=Pseudactinotalea sp. Z1748 TaxID=3413027 RepID=UPI003C7CA0DA